MYETERQRRLRHVSTPNLESAMASPSSSAHAPTIDAAAIRHAVTVDSAPSNSNPCARVAMVEGSQPHLSAETRSLLRGRLRIAALLLATGFAVFFFRNLFFTDFTSGPQLFMTFFHGVVTVALALVGGGLCHKCTFELSTLRRAELIIFGLPAVYFIAMQWLAYKHIGGLIESGPAFLESPAAPWILLILVYSLYVPNTWQRAAWILGLMAIAPVAILFAAWLKIPAVNERISVRLPSSSTIPK